MRVREDKRQCKENENWNNLPCSGEQEKKRAQPVGVVGERYWEKQGGCCSTKGGKNCVNSIRKKKRSRAEKRGGWWGNCCKKKKSWGGILRS